MALLDIHSVLRNMKVFSDDEISQMFRKHSMVFNPIAIELDSDISKLQMTMNYNAKHHLRYRVVAKKLRAKRKQLEKYENAQNALFADEVVRLILARGSDLDILDAYFSCLLRTPKNKQVSRKYSQLIRFAEYAMPVVSQMQGRQH